MDKKQELKNTLLNLGTDLAHAETEDQCREVDMKALKAIEEFEQRSETGQVDAVVSDTINKEKYINWLKGLRDSSGDEQAKDMYNALILDTENLW